jgi:glycosyltransferase involved in cell wall biosynthesis
MMHTRVSVAIPVYQGARFLEASLRSVFAQSFRDFDVTVVDDGSTDGSVSLAERVARERGNGIAFRVVRNETRQGLVGNWNRCLTYCTGEYSLLFHQDDVLDPDMLQRAVAAFASYPHAGYVYFGYRCMDEEDRDLPPWATSPFSGATGGVPFIKAMLRENFICCPAVVVPRAVYERVGVYDRRFAFSPDFEMWLRIASRYDVVCRPEIGVRYRLHTSQATEAFRHARKVRGDLEYLTAALMGLRERRDSYPELWKSVVRDNLWMLRQHAFAAPRDALWAIGILANCSSDVTAAVRDALLEKLGLRASAPDRVV